MQIPDLHGGLVFGVWWLWYVLGTVGIGGLIALLVLAPAVVETLLQGAVKFFFGTRIGAALLAGFIAFQVADIWRSTSDAKYWKAEKAAMIDAAKRRETKIAEDTAVEARKEMADLAVSSSTTDQAIKEFANAQPVRFPETPARQIDPLAISDADADRLCIIATGKACVRLQPKGGAVPLPRARPKAADSQHHRRKLPDLIRRGVGRAE